MGPAEAQTHDAGHCGQIAESRLNHGVVIGPGFFEAMSQFLHRLRAFGSPHQESRSRCTKTPHQPDQLLHRSSLLFAFRTSATYLPHPVSAALPEPDELRQKAVSAPRASAFGCKRAAPSSPRPGLPAHTLAVQVIRRASCIGRTLGAMDRVRFGRALGYGARHAAKTLAAAAEAATSPPPQRSTSAARPESQSTPQAGPSGTAATARYAAARQFTQSAATHTAGRDAAARIGAVGRRAPQAKAQARGLGRSVWAPLARFSGVLWLEVTGTFFTLIALFVGSGAWRLRGAIHAPASSAQAQKLYLHAAIFLLFAYFAFSSFLRAHRRGRR